MPLSSRVPARLGTMPRRLLRRASSWAAKRSVDVHSHMYLPRYLAMLRQRGTVPRVTPGTGAGAADRLLILPGEDLEDSTAAGRPIGAEYVDVATKLRFMDRHGIAVSVVSLANPWLDFLDAAEATMLASQLNDDLQTLCEDSGGRLAGFGVVAPQDPLAAAREVERMARDLPALRGFVLGTTGAGRGLDDAALEPLWCAAEAAGAMVFVHPHYGVGNEHFAGTGHALFLALGFPFETTTAVARLIVSGTLDRHRELRLLLAHAGGTLPFLAGRLDSCVAHDLALATRLEHPPSAYLQRMYYDSTIYGEGGLAALLRLVGPERVMWGTDNPFFPPMNPATGDFDPAAEADWPSTVKNYGILDALDDAIAQGILRGNAERLLGIRIP